MVPAFDGGDDPVWIGGPFEGLGAGVPFGDEAVDGGLGVTSEWNAPRLRHRLVSLAKAFDGVKSRS